MGWKAQIKVKPQEVRNAIKTKITTATRSEVKILKELKHQEKRAADLAAAVTDGEAHKY